MTVAKTMMTTTVDPHNFKSTTTIQQQKANTTTGPSPHKFAVTVTATTTDMATWLL